MKRLEPTSKKFSIDWPCEKYISEFEIQAFIFSSLRSLGIDVRGEVVHRVATKGERGRACRFDLVIFRDKIATAIVECKGDSRSGTVPVNQSGRQMSRYREYGVPVYFVRGMYQAELFVERCKLQKAKDEPRQSSG